MKMKIDEEQKRKKELLIERFKEMAEDNLKITKEFEAIEDLSGWEWNYEKIDLAIKISFGLD